MKKRLIVSLAVSIACLATGSASAHVVVKPSDALTGAFQNFTVGVPNEKDAPVTAVKLLVPDSLQYVTPNVKTGWNVNIEKEGQGETAKIKSITWSGGSIPVGLRDDFGFSAKTPDKAADIQWKAYQTYENGQVVAWDKKSNEQPKKADGSPDFSMSGPFSVTKVAAKPVSAQNNSNNDNQDNASNNQTRLLSLAALAISILAFALVTRKNKAESAQPVNKKK